MNESIRIFLIFLLTFSCCFGAGFLFMEREKFKRLKKGDL